MEQEREKLGSELSEAQNIYMQSLEDVKVHILLRMRRGVEAFSLFKARALTILYH